VSVEIGRRLRKTGCLPTTADRKWPGEVETAKILKFPQLCFTSMSPRWNDLAARHNAVGVRNSSGLKRVIYGVASNAMAGDELSMVRPAPFNAELCTKPFNLALSGG
jgi:hypothetical protein